MNKKAGLLINTVILVVVLVVGIFIGLRLGDKSDELVQLQDENAGLREQLQKLEELNDAELGKCVNDFEDAFRNQELADNKIGVVFVRNMSSSELVDFAEKYNRSCHSI
jgi:hypothetical protein